VETVLLIPDYDLLRRIGAGAYGEVWLARSTATGVLRAAKIVWRRTFEDERPFQREFAGIQRFEQVSRAHPSQLALFHIGRSDAQGCFYYLMELADAAEPEPGGGVLERRGNGKATDDRWEPGLPGSRIPGPDRAGAPRPEDAVSSYVAHTLRADLGRGRLPAARVLEIGLALAEALGHLHRHGLVHRDVKPSNVIFVNGRPKLADIGLVTDASDQCSIVGTEGYLPPEGPGTAQADIFALGKVLYEAATGLDRRQCPRLPEDLRSWADAKVVFELNEILLKSCASDPRARYASAEAMLADLQLLQRGRSVKSRRTWDRLRVAVTKLGIALGVLALLAAGEAVISQRSGTSTRARDGPASTNILATALCAKGMLILQADSYPQFAEAYTNFHHALELDPHFARPYRGLLELRLRESVPALGPTSSEEMRGIARKLGELAPGTAPAYCAESVTSFYDWDFPRAEACGLRAIRADPDYELGHTFYAYILMLWGRLAEARAQMTASQSLAPSKVTIYRSLANIYYAERDYTNAIAWYRKTLEWESHHGIAYGQIGQCYLVQGDYLSAITNFEARELLYTTNGLETRRRYQDLLHAFTEGGARGYWQSRWTETEKKPNADFYRKAVVQIHLGDTNAAMDWLGRSYETHEHWEGEFQTPLEDLLHDDCWDGLRDHPRFKELLDKVGFTKVMARSQPRLRRTR